MTLNCSFWISGPVGLRIPFQRPEAIEMTDTRNKEELPGWSKTDPDWHPDPGLFTGIVTLPKFKPKKCLSNGYFRSFIFSFRRSGTSVAETILWKALRLEHIFGPCQCQDASDPRTPADLRSLAKSSNTPHHLSHQLQPQNGKTINKQRDGCSAHTRFRVPKPSPSCHPSAATPLSRRRSGRPLSFHIPSYASHAPFNRNVLRVRGASGLAKMQDKGAECGD